MSDLHDGGGGLGSSSPVILGEADVARLRRIAVPYNRMLGEYISDEFAGGKSLSEIARMPGMPTYGALLAWHKDNKEFREMLKAAQETRALHFEEMAREEVDAILASDDKDRAPVARLVFDKNVWSAGVSDPAKYGKKTTISGDSGRPIVFNIVTGVPAPDLKQVELDSTGLVKEVIEVASEVVENEASSN